MTDNEIVKALECCANLEACEKCPMGSMEKYDIDTCEHQIMLYSLDLINRQKAEIERLNNELKITREYLHDNGLEWDLLSKSEKQKCDCYHTETKRRYTYNPLTGDPVGHDIEVGVCWGTKECDECSCNGDESKCDFYPKKRNGG